MRYVNCKAIGELTEARFLAKFISLGYRVLRPWGDNCRYDLVVDNDGKFIRVQCKTGSMSKSRVWFKGYSNGSTVKRKTYLGEVDAFAIYVPTTDKYYYIPMEFIGDGKENFFRVGPPLHASKKAILQAEQFEI